MIEGDRLIKFAKRVTLFITAGLILREALNAYSIAELFPHSDKLLHACAFYILALLADLSFPEKKFLFFNLSGLLLFGVTIEVLQRYTTGRDFSFLDMAANTLGMSLFYLSVPLLKKIPMLKRIWQPDSPDPDKRFIITVLDDSGETGLALEEVTLGGVDVAESLTEECRYLNRSRDRLVGDEKHLKNRIRALLAKYDYRIPTDFDDSRRWSGACLKWLENLRFPAPYAREAHVLLLNQLKENHWKQARVLRNMKQMTRREPELSQALSLLQTVPGVGFLTAFLFITEIIDMSRFRRFEELVHYVDMALSGYSSDKRSVSKNMGSLYDELFALLIESSWIAVRKEQRLTMIFSELCSRMDRDAAIIRIAKILLSHMCSVWQNQRPFVYEGIEYEPEL